MLDRKDDIVIAEGKNEEKEVNSKAVKKEKSDYNV